MLERNEFIEFILPDVEEFIEQKNWHELKIALSEWPPQDLAYLIQSLRDEYKIIVFRLLPKDIQVEVFSELDYEIQEKLIHKLADEEVRSIIEELEPDDRAGLFEELPGQIVQKLLQPPFTRRKKSYTETPWLSREHRRKIDDAILRCCEIPLDLSRSDRTHTKIRKRSGNHRCYLCCGPEGASNR
jgi:Mg/Co/Ni transporter MgtE